MPRVENLGPNVDKWFEEVADGCGSSTYDICRWCNIVLSGHPNKYNHKLVPYNGDPQGTEGWGGDVDHPPFEEYDYTCEICERPLTAVDD